MEPRFRAHIESAFFLKERGVVILIHLPFEGIVKPGDMIAIPFSSGEVRKVKVKGVEYLDSWHPRNVKVGLWFEPQDIQEILIGGEVVGMDED